MGQILINKEHQSKTLKNDVVIQGTKKQFIKFLLIIVVLLILAVNILAITISSPLLKELLIAQTIFILIFFIKNSKTNNIVK